MGLATRDVEADRKNLESDEAECREPCERRRDAGGCRQHDPDGAGELARADEESSQWGMSTL